MASQRRCNQRLAVVRCRHRFLSCCPSGNCLFPPLKRAKEQMGGRPWSESPTPWHFGGEAALRNPQPSISGQPGVVTSHLSFFGHKMKKLQMYYVQLCVLAG